MSGIELTNYEKLMLKRRKRRKKRIKSFVIILLVLLLRLSEFLFTYRQTKNLKN